MAISEACQVWIEQRISEELEVQSHTGKSLRAIGKDIAKEIERVFDAKINPETIKSRVLRMAGSNEPPHPTNREHNEIKEKPSEVRGSNGHFKEGTKPGPGRAPKYKKENEVSEDEERLLRAYNAFFTEVSAAKTNHWKEVSKKRINDLISNLISLVEA